MSAALPLRSYTPLRMVLTVCGRCFSEDPDREVDYVLGEISSSPG